MKRKKVDLKKLYPSDKAWWDIELVTVISEAVSKACGIEVSEFSETMHKKPGISERRFIHAAMLKRHVPRIPLKVIAAHNGCSDHTSAIKQLERCQEFLDTKCPIFRSLHYKSSRAASTAVKKYKEKLLNGVG